MKGRKSKPLAVQIAAGDPRKVGKQKLLDRLNSEPKPTRGLPDCPEHIACVRPVTKGKVRLRQTPCGNCIPCRTRRQWSIWAEDLAIMDLDYRPDAPMLEGACVAYAVAVDADCIIAREGSILDHVTRDPQTKGEMTKKRSHPAEGVSRRAWAQVRSFCSEFGLDPNSRQRLAVEKKQEVESQDLASMLSQPRQTRFPMHVN